MSSDDLTRDIANEGGNITQPTIEAVFRLLNEIKLDVQNVNGRLDTIDGRLDAVYARLDATNAQLDTFNARLDTFNARLDEVESRLARDIEGVNTRVLQGFREISNKIDILNRSRLQTEADYLGLQKRVTDLESKAS